MEVGDWVVKPGTESHPEPEWVRLAKRCRRCPAAIPADRRLCGECLRVARIVRRLRRPPSCELRPKVYRRDKGRCAICRVDASRSGWICDHIIPLGEGGHPGDLRNLRTLCLKCEKEVTRQMLRRRLGWVAEEAARGSKPRPLGRRLPQGRPGHATETEPDKGTNMKLGDAFPSKWLKASDAEDEPLVLTIRQVDMEEFKDNNGQASEKLVARFEENDKGFVINKTNATVLGGLFGNDTDDWIGKKIQLICLEVQFGSDLVPALRVSKKGTADANKKRPAKVAAPAAGDDEGDEDIPF